MNKKRDDDLKKSCMAESLIYERNHRNFWAEYKKLEGHSKQKPPHMNDRIEPKDIAELFTDKYSTLYNSVPSEKEELCSIKKNILFGFPGISDDAIVINYCVLYAKHYIYLEKLKENKNQNPFNIDFLGYLSKLKYILKIEKSICTNKNQNIKFNKFNCIYDNL